MRHAQRVRIGVLTALLSLLAACAAADSGLIRLTSFPSVSVADGRSTITISAEIRDTNGSLVPNGTQIVFSISTGGGMFREPVVPTQNGIAHAVLIAGSIPGTAKITATALAYNATTTLEYEFVGDRSLLSTAKEYVEITAPRRLAYSMDQRIIGASGDGEKVFIRYREIEIEADLIQLDVPNYELRAKKAKLKMGKIDREFDDLYLKLNQRTGFGTTIYKGPSLVIHPLAIGFLPEVRESIRYGLVAISASGIKPPSTLTNPSIFEFKDLTETETTIVAKKAVAFPRKNIQFHQAQIYMGEAKVMALPLFQVNLYGNTPLFAEQIVNVNDNQLAINYPHYLSLKPGETSLLRLTTGESYGRGYGVNRGLFLNYELNWNRGDDMDGGLTLTGLNRADWGVGMRHFQRIDDRTTANAQVEFPAHKSLYGSGSLSRQFDGFSMSLNGSNTRTLHGPKWESQQYSFIAEKDPTKVGNLPLRLYYGVTASSLSSQTDTLNLSQQSAGFRARLQMQPQNLDKATSVSGSFLVSKLYGQNTLSGLGYNGDISLRRTLGREASLVVGYNFNEDGYTSNLIGRHSLSLQAYYGAGRTSFSAFATRSIDINRLNYFIDASYRISGIWRLSSSYTFSQYLTDSYLDYNFMLGYMFGGREFGVAWSNRTKRFSFQVLGSPIG